MHIHPKIKTTHSRTRTFTHTHIHTGTYTAPSSTRRFWKCFLSYVIHMCSILFLFLSTCCIVEERENWILHLFSRLLCFDIRTTHTPPAAYTIHDFLFLSFFESLFSRTQPNQRFALTKNTWKWEWKKIKYKICMSRSLNTKPQNQQQTLLWKSQFLVNNRYHWSLCFSELSNNNNRFVLIFVSLCL